MTSSVSGIASSAPRAPSTQLQKSSAMNVTVIESPTESPMNRGWTSVCTTKLSSEYTTTMAISSLHPPASRPSSAGGMTPRTNPMLGT